ncbi:MAG: capA3 [Myxococcaceae bacterium]|nr:capA3 [Myxococcaceae bacterium]
MWSLLAAAPVVSVLFGGDVTLGFHYEEYVDEQVKKGKSREAMLAHGFQKVLPLAEKADLFVVNLECPFTDQGEKIPKNFNFRARPELVASLQSGSVDVVSLANNHLLDYGPGGLTDTQATLDGAKIVHFGAGATLAAARAPAIVTVKGVKIAFLGYFFLGDRNIEPKEVIATDSTPGVAGHHSDLATLRGWVIADVKAARARADVVIPFFHWGREGRTAPEPYQIELAHAAIDTGAAAVIGSHPHVLQGIELYQGRPILYSLGNFVFGGNWDPKDKRTAMVRMDLDARGVRKTTVIPAFSDRFPEVPIQPYPAEGEAAEAVLDHLGEISAGFKATLPELKGRSTRKDGGP